jgi:hypothetical protein
MEDDQSSPKQPAPKKKSGASGLETFTQLVQAATLGLMLAVAVVFAFIVLGPIVPLLLNPALAGPAIASMFHAVGAFITQPVVVFIASAISVLSLAHRSGTDKAIVKQIDNLGRSFWGHSVGRYRLGQAIEHNVINPFRERFGTHNARAIVDDFVDGKTHISRGHINIIPGETPEAAERAIGDLNDRRSLEAARDEIARLGRGLKTHGVADEGDAARHENLRLAVSAKLKSMREGQTR